MENPVQDSWQSIEANLEKEDKALLSDLKKFVESTEDETSFPPSFSSKQRRQVHALCEQINELILGNDFKLFSESKGEGESRCLVLSKRKRTDQQIKQDPYKKISLYARERLCKDYLLPIELFESPYFEYFVELYDPLLQVKKRLRSFQDAAAICGNESKFWTHLNDVKTKIISHITSDPTFKALSTKEIQNKFAVNKSQNEFPSQKNVYEEENHGKVFISLDLISANYNSLRYYNSKIVKDCKSWKEFVGTFTKCEYIWEAKRLRQVIMGSVGGKYCTFLERYITAKIWEELHALNFSFYSFSNDELIIHSSEESVKQNIEDIKTLLQNKLPEIAEIVKIQGFRLFQLKPRAFYVKEAFTNLDNLSEVEPSFKAVTPNLFAQCFKAYFKMPITEMDKKFVMNGIRATFDVPLFPA